MNSIYLNALKRMEFLFQIHVCPFYNSNSRSIFTIQMQGNACDIMCNIQATHYVPAGLFVRGLLTRNQSLRFLSVIRYLMTSREHISFFNVRCTMTSFSLGVLLSFLKQIYTYFLPCHLLL